MHVVKAIEAVGTASGKPRKRVTIVDCGELPSRRMILKRIQAEKEELANLKKDPIAVNPPPPFLLPFHPGPHRPRSQTGQFRKQLIIVHIPHPLLFPFSKIILKKTLFSGCFPHLETPSAVMSLRALVLR